MPGSGRSVGKRITSRIEGLPVTSMTSRSTPMPRPPVGGIPYSSAADVVEVDVARLRISGPLQRGFGLESCELVDRIIQLAVGVREFVTVDDELEPLDQRRIVAVSTGQR